MITEQNAWDLSVLAPFGEGNREPLFVTKNMVVKEMWMLGNGNHLKLMLINPYTGQAVPAIGFGMSRFDGLIAPGDTVDVAYSMTINHWNGNASLQLKLRDIHLSECPKWEEIDPDLAELDRISTAREEPLADAAERLGCILEDLVPCKAQFTAVVPVPAGQLRGRPPVVRPQPACTEDRAQLPGAS